MRSLPFIIFHRLLSWCSCDPICGLSSPSAGAADQAAHGAAEGCGHLAWRHHDSRCAPPFGLQLAVGRYLLALGRFLRTANAALDTRLCFALCLVLPVNNRPILDIGADQLSKWALYTSARARESRPPGAVKFTGSEKLFVNFADTWLGIADAIPSLKLSHPRRSSSALHVSTTRMQPDFTHENTPSAHVW